MIGAMVTRKMTTGEEEFMDIRNFKDSKKTYFGIGLVLLFALVVIGISVLSDKEPTVPVSDKQAEMINTEIKEEPEEKLLGKRTTETEIEGVETAYTEIQYFSDQGYSLWYPENLKPENINGYDGFLDSEDSNVEIIIVPQESDLSLDDEYLKEAAANYRVSGEYKVVTVSKVKNLTSEDRNVTIRMIEVVHDGDMNRFYIVEGKEQMLLITVSLEEEAVEEWKTKITKMVQTIIFDENEK